MRFRRWTVLLPDPRHRSGEDERSRLNKLGEARLLMPAHDRSGPTGFQTADGLISQRARSHGSINPEYGTSPLKIALRSVAGAGARGAGVLLDPSAPEIAVLFRTHPRKTALRRAGEVNGASVLSCPCPVVGRREACEVTPSHACGDRLGLGITSASALDWPLQFAHGCETATKLRQTCSLAREDHTPLLKGALSCGDAISEADCPKSPPLAFAVRTRASSTSKKPNATALVNSVFGSLLVRLASNRQLRKQRKLGRFPRLLHVRAAISSWIARNSAGTHQGKCIRLATFTDRKCRLAQGQQHSRSLAKLPEPVAAGGV